MYVAEHVVPLARERLSEEPIPSCCRLLARRMVGKRGPVTKNATRGYSQESIFLGPSLWNLVFDDTLGRRGVRSHTWTTS